MFQIPLERPSNFPQSYVESTHRREFFERFGNNMEEDHLQQLHERGAGGGGGAVLLGDLEATALAGKDNTSPDVISLKVYLNWLLLKQFNCLWEGRTKNLFFRNFIILNSGVGEGRRISSPIFAILIGEDIKRGDRKKINFIEN